MTHTTGDRRQQGGFTLIELLVVVIIIGILAAIAIPAFLNQRQAAFDRAALSDLRNLIPVESGILAERGVFSQVPSEIAAEDWVSSADVVVCARTSNAGRDVTLSAWHANGGTVYSWTSFTSLTSAVAAPVPGNCDEAIAPGAQEVS